MINSNFETKSEQLRIISQKLRQRLVNLESCVGALECVRSSYELLRCDIPVDLQDFMVRADALIDEFIKKFSHLLV